MCVVCVYITVYHHFVYKTIIDKLGIGSCV